MTRHAPLLLALTLAATSAHAQRAPLPSGIARTQITPAPLFQTVALACDREHAYVRNAEGRVMRWDGTAWTEHAPPVVSYGSGRRMWVAPGGEIVLDVGGALARWDGRAWQPIAVDRWFGGGGRGLDVSAIAGLGTPWLIGRGAIGIAIDGTVRPFDLDDAWYALHDLVVFASDHVLVASDAGLLRWDGRAWSRVATGLEGPVHDVLASSPDDVWLLGQGGVARWDGHAWSIANEGLDVGALPRARWGARHAHLGGASPDRVYLTTPDRVLRFAGGRWTQVLDETQRSPFASFGEVCATARHVVIEEGGHALVIAR